MSRGGIGRFYVCLFCGRSVSRVNSYPDGVTEIGHAGECAWTKLHNRYRKERTRMGMFDKDKVFADDGPMDKWVADKVPFILFSCEIKDEKFQWGSDPGDTARMAHWEVAPLDYPENRAMVSTIGSAMAAKVDNQEDGDLPAIVQTNHVPVDKGNDAYVLQFIAPYTKAEAKRVLEETKEPATA